MLFPMFRRGVSVSLGIAVCMGVMGCAKCSPTQQAISAVEGGFKPAQLPIPKPASQPVYHEGDYSIIVGKIHLAQTFTITTSGVLGGLDLGCEKLASYPGPLLLDICRTQEGVPVDDEGEALISVEIPRGAETGKPVNANLAPPPVAGIDLSAFHLQVHAGEVLAFTVRHSENAGFSFGLVTGHAYKGGMCYGRWDNSAWKPQQPPCNMHFRVYVLTDQKPPSTQAAARAVRMVPGGSRPERGIVVAESMPNAPQPRPTPPPPPAPVPLQVTSRMFQSEGIWYLEFSQFNGSPRPVAINTNPSSIEALRTGETQSREVKPGGSNANRLDMRPAFQLGPNEGFIKQIAIVAPRRLRSVEAALAGFNPRRFDLCH